MWRRRGDDVPAAAAGARPSARPPNSSRPTPPGSQQLPPPTAAAGPATTVLRRGGQASSFGALPTSSVFALHVTALRDAQPSHAWRHTVVTVTELLQVTTLARVASGVRRAPPNPRMHVVMLCTS
ncbi:MAG: hypothetical protein EOO65_05930 [Methanosarcinales archaeon]|nr:MAG: hypothetical protein EOO65_05930 [Methanosarcinales archaeon]